MVEPGDRSLQTLSKRNKTYRLRGFSLHMINAPRLNSTSATFEGENLTILAEYIDDCNGMSLLHIINILYYLII